MPSNAADEPLPRPFEMRVRARLAPVLLGFGIVAACWLPVLSQPIFTFYKEWLFVVAFALAGLSLAPGKTAHPPLHRHPLALAIAAILVVLLVQSVVMTSVWHRAVLVALAAGFFLFSIALGRGMDRRAHEQSLPWLAAGLVVAGFGMCFFAALQLNRVGFDFPFVLPRSPGRVDGNLAQANHYSDLLWVASVAAVFLHARRKLGVVATAFTVLVFQGFASFGGSRTVWVYIVLLAMIAAATLWRRPPVLAARRFAIGLLALCGAYVVVVAVLSATGAFETFGISSAEERATTASTSNSQRLWHWRAGVDAAEHQPLLGVGVGRLAGHSLALAMTVADSPPGAADAQSHNIFVQLAAEMGVPLALFVAACFLVWVVAAWRRAASSLDVLAALAMAAPIVVHANFEHPLGYMYFIGLLGLLVGHVPQASPTSAEPAKRRDPAPLLQALSVAVLVVAAMVYIQYERVAKATQVVLAQMRQGAPPQPSQALAASLREIPAWSPFADYAELVAIITALPTRDNAVDLMARCDRALQVGPAPHLLARCATAFQVGGRPERASYYANSLCRLYPNSVGVLIQSMMFVERVSPAAGNLQSACVDRVK